MEGRQKTKGEGIAGQDSRSATGSKNTFGIPAGIQELGFKILSRLPFSMKNRVSSVSCGYQGNFASIGPSNKR